MQISKVSTKDILNNPLIERPGAKWTVCNSHWMIVFVFLDYFQIQLKLIRIIWIMLNTNPVIEYASIKNRRQQNLRRYFRQSDFPKKWNKLLCLCDFNLCTLFLDCKKFIFIFLLDLGAKKHFQEKIKQQTAKYILLYLI